MTNAAPPKFAKTLGILGGGQLGRMSAMAAARLGIKTHIYTPEALSPASQVSAKTFVGDYDNKDLLKEFAESVDVISYEFENIPIDCVKFLKTIKPVYPDENLLEISQHRWNEKTFLNQCGIHTARWAKATSAADIQSTLEQWSLTSCIIKTTRFGYDGKGQAKIDISNGQPIENTIQTAWESLKTDEAIIEQIVPFQCELSVIAARDTYGKIICYPPTLNEHQNHILSKSIAPAPLDKNIIEKSLDITKNLVHQIGLVGVMALEMFLTKDGEIIANEIAPRTHNSGHWTIDACSVSQFENHVRAVCGLPLGDPTPHSDAIMYNLIGDDIDRLDQFWTQKGASIHLYGKSEPLPGRKMGHVTIIS